MALMQIEDPLPKTPQAPSWRAFFSYAFRPLYLLAAVQGALFVLVWAFDQGGTHALPGFLWHGHEMVWGYAGAIIVGFLLTAVATWTGRPPVQGVSLAILVSLWVGARVLLLVVPNTVLPGAILSVAFYVFAAALFAVPVAQAGNVRNFVPVGLVLAFGLADALFLGAIAGVVKINLLAMLHTGLLLVAVVIFLMGLRVIPFFTARGLQKQQVGNPRGLVLIGIGFPFLMALSLAFGTPAWLPAALGLIGATANLIALVRWWRRGVTGEPMLWVLFAGFGCTAAGVWLYGALLVLAPHLLSGAVHLIAVGGIGVLTVGMMTRTALGHTGRPIAAPRGMPVAFALMLVAAAVRVWSVFQPELRDPLVILSGVCFAIALALFVIRFAPWLVRPRADGR